MATETQEEQREREREREREQAARGCKPIKVRNWLPRLRNRCKHDCSDREYKSNS